MFGQQLAGRARPDGIRCNQFSVGDPLACQIRLEKLKRRSRGRGSHARRTQSSATHNEPAGSRNVAMMVGAPAITRAVPESFPRWPPQFWNCWRAGTAYEAWLGARTTLRPASIRRFEKPAGRTQGQRRHAQVLLLRQGIQRSEEWSEGTVGSISTYYQPAMPVGDHFTGWRLMTKSFGFRQARVTVRPTVSHSRPRASTPPCSFPSPNGMTQ